MNEFLALLRREWLEHRAAFTWGPAVILGLLLLTALMATGLGEGFQMTIGDRSEVEEILGTSEVSGLQAAAALALDVAGSTDVELEQKMQIFLTGLAQPFHLLLLVLMFFALIASLYDERRDHSVLFWKSMPVSDGLTVASKYVFVAWIAPIVTIVAIVAAQIVAVALSSIYVEDGMGGRVWSASGIWFKPFELAFGYIFFGIWAMPLFGWVLLVSAWAKRAPILWAVGLPALLIVLERIVFGTDLLSSAIGTHLDNVMLANAEVGDNGEVRFLTLADQLAVFARLQFWGGVVVGGIFVAVTVYLRRYRNEI